MVFGFVCFRRLRSIGSLQLVCL